MSITGTILSLAVVAVLGLYLMGGRVSKPWAARQCARNADASSAAQGLAESSPVPVDND